MFDFLLFFPLFLLRLEFINLLLHFLKHSLSSQVLLDTFGPQGLREFLIVCKLVTG